MIELGDNIDKALRKRIAHYYLHRHEHPALRAEVYASIENLREYRIAKMAKAELGRVRPPYGGITNCANACCPTPELSEKLGAYMYRDLESDKLVIFCGDCARHVELNVDQRFKLVAL